MVKTDSQIKKEIIDVGYKQSKTKKNILVLLIYLAAITVSEIVVAYYDLQMGLILDVLILVALLINSSLHESKNFSFLLRSMMVLPLIRIIGLSIPMMEVEPLYWFPIIAIPLFAASYTLIRSQKLTRYRIGLISGNIPIQLLIALSGVLLGFTEYLILKPQPLISSLSPESVLIASIILIISTGFAEELLFRGILQKNAEDVIGKVYGLIYASILFTALHIGWDSIVDLLFVFGVALYYGYAFQRTNSIFGITLSHGLSNTVLFLIMPFTAFYFQF